MALFATVRWKSLSKNALGSVSLKNHMAKKTRSIKQYASYELVILKEGAPNNVGDPKISWVPTAVFDDETKLNAYVKDAGLKKKEYEVRENWSDKEPVEGGFSLPFNPKYEAPQE